MEYLDKVRVNRIDPAKYQPLKGTVSTKKEAIQKHLEEGGFEDVGGEFTYIANDLKDVEPAHRETIDKMVERLEEFDDVQTVYTNMKPEESEE